MTALIAVWTGDGCAGRCDAKCYNAWGPECHCICQGANHGAGKQEAIDNTRELGESWLEHVRADGQVVAYAEVLIDTLHEPLLECGRPAAGIQEGNRYAAREALAC
jgi:hypothetical protein